LPRIRPIGSGLCGLLEISLDGKPQKNLDEVLADLAALGLGNMPLARREKLRLDLMKIHFLGGEELASSPTKSPGGKLSVQDIIAALKKIAIRLREVEPLLRGSQSGFRTTHEIEVALKLREALASSLDVAEPSLKDSSLSARIDQSQEFLTDFCSRLDAVAKACAKAGADLAQIKGNKGRTQSLWFEEFTRVLVSLAEEHGLRTTIEKIRETRMYKGPILDMAWGFQQLFYPDYCMRAKSRAGLADRLQEAIQRQRHRGKYHPRKSISPV
jgi:hypothetical protein